MIDVINGVRQILEDATNNQVPVYYQRNRERRQQFPFITFSYTTNPRTFESEDFYVRIFIYDNSSSVAGIEELTGKLSHYFNTVRYKQLNGLLFRFQSVAVEAEALLDSDSNHTREMQLITQVTY